jgi:hypothetical protein
MSGFWVIANIHATLGHVGNVEIGGRVSRLPLDQSERSCSTL